MSWSAYFHPKFMAEVEGLSAAVQDGIASAVAPLRQFGPTLGRPDVDTLNGSKFANMKELRFKATEEFGALPLRSTHNVMQSFWSQRTSRA